MTTTTVVARYNVTDAIAIYLKENKNMNNICCPFDITRKDGFRKFTEPASNLPNLPNTV